MLLFSMTDLLMSYNSSFFVSKSSIIADVAEFSVHASVLSCLYILKQFVTELPPFSQHTFPADIIDYMYI